MSKVKKENGKVLISQELYDELLYELRRKDAEIARVNAEADQSKAEAAQNKAEAALCREALADKETQLMSEQARRGEMVEAQVKVREQEVFAKYSDMAKSLDEREANLERQKMDMVDKMHEYVKAEVEKARLEMEARKNEEINAFKLKLYNIQQSALATLRSLITGKGDPVKTDACLRDFEQKTRDAREEMTSEYYKAMEKLSKKKISLNRQVQSLLRMIFLQKSEKWKPSPEDRKKYEDYVMKALELTPEKHEEYKKALDFVRDYRHRKEAAKIAMGEPGSGHGRNPIPEEIPRLAPTILTPKEVEENPDGYTKIGEDVQEWVVAQPMRLYVRVVIRGKYVKKGDPFAKPVQVPAESEAIYKSYAANETLAAMEVSKYYYHIPFYRFQSLLRQSGWEVSRSTIDGWHDEVCRILEPLYRLHKDIVMNVPYLAGDGSPMPLVNKDKHRTVNYYMVSFRDVVSGDVVFIASPNGSRSKGAVQEVLGGWNGRAFLCDAYQGYDWLKKKGVTLVRCNAHGRRKFDATWKENKSVAGGGISTYQLIYTADGELKGKSNEEILSVRNELERPLWEGFLMWAQLEILNVPQGSQAYNALNYLIRHYDELTAYLDIPEMPMDNNGTEAEIRKMVIGKQNYLFCQTPEACERAAMMYSFMGSCRVYGVDPHEWLVYVLKRIDTVSVEELYTLLPRFYAQFNKR